MSGSLSRSAVASGSGPVLAGGAEWQAYLCEQLEAFLPIEAPAQEEHARGRWFLARAQALGYTGATQDAVGNVLVPFDPAYAGRYLVLDAHLDTAFARGTPIHLRKTGRLWHAPGVYDDGAGLAIQLGLMKLFRAEPPSGAERLLFCFSVGEEGVGDLAGMRELCRMYGDRIAALYTLDGLMGKESIGTVGSRRYRITVRGPGGHSWADFGRPSAIHEMTQWLAGLQEVLAEAVAGAVYPRMPGASTFNVGTLQGGSTVNSIAGMAECEIDLRSSDAGPLGRLIAVLEASLREYRWPDGMAYESRVIGDRPTADGSAAMVLRNLRAGVHRDFGLETRETLDSTNANWPLSLGIPATSVGVAVGGDAHTPEEWLDVTSLLTGLRFTRELTVRTLVHPALQGRYAADDAV